MREPQIGDRIGQYRLVRLLGQGTTGRVFEVEHDRIGRRAAMKTLSAEHAARPGAVKRLFTEALAINRINHPHIVEVTDIVEDGAHHVIVNGQPALSPQPVNALVMEILEGQSLTQAVLGEGPLPPERFLPIMAQVCEALAAAHAAGFVHRDLKPDNIFLIQRGEESDYVKLLDFGLAKTVNVEPALLENPALKTLDGSFVGTPAYVSPEQASGKKVDHRTDIYSVGVVLYELICGRLPFESSSMGDLLVQHMTGTPPPLPDEILSTKLGRSLDAIVQRCLEKTATARFPSAAQLAEIFARLGRGEPIQFTMMEAYVGSWPRRRLNLQRPAARVGLGLGVALVLSLITGLIIARLRDEKRQETPAVVASPPKPGGLPASGDKSPPQSVTLSFESEPPGAEARVVGAKTLLGVTPFEQTFARNSDPLEVELKLAGYEPIRVTTSAAVSRAISVTLTRSHGPGPPRRPRVGAFGKETTIDPFR